MNLIALLLSSLIALGQEVSTSDPGLIEAPAFDLNGPEVVDASWFCANRHGRFVLGRLDATIASDECIVMVKPESGSIHAIMETPPTFRYRHELSDAELEKATTDAMARLNVLGIGPEQLGEIEARYINFVNSDEPDVEYTSEIKVWVGRSYSRTPVGGHRAVFTYDLDGTLREVRMTWPRISVEESEWTLPATGPCSNEGVRTWFENDQGIPESKWVEKSLVLVPEPLPGHLGVSRVELKWVVVYLESESPRPWMSSKVCGEAED